MVTLRSDLNILFQKIVQEESVIMEREKYIGMNIVLKREWREFRSPYRQRLGTSLNNFEINLCIVVLHCLFTENIFHC